MIPLITLCGEYVDLRKLTEQKKSFEYVVPPPTKVVRNNKGHQLSESSWTHEI